MEPSEHSLSKLGQARSQGAEGDERIRLIAFSRGDVWPDRRSCELVLVLECRATGFDVSGLDAPLRVGELALLPLGNGFHANARGRVLAARMDALPAPSIPQRLNDRLISQLLQRAWGSYDTAREIVAPALLLVELLLTVSVHGEQERSHLAERIDPRIVRAINYVEAHYGKPLTKAKLAAVACLSPSHFSRIFKATTGVSVWTYVNRCRCERAKEMLLTTQEPIAEIAYRCGFANQAHLTRCFKEAFDFTPAVVRRNGYLKCD